MVVFECLPFHASVSDQAIYKARFVLSDPINATDGLRIVNRVPGDVKHYDAGGGGYINSDTSRPGRNKEYCRPIKSGEVVDNTFPLKRAGTAVNPPNSLCPIVTRQVGRLANKLSDTIQCPLKDKSQPDTFYTFCVAPYQDFEKSRLVFRPFRRIFSGFLVGWEFYIPLRDCPEYSCLLFRKILPIRWTRMF